MTDNRNSKLLLVYPPITRYERYGSAIGAGGGQQIPLGIYYLAAYVRRQGYPVEVIDAEALNRNNDQIVQYVREHAFDVVGISTTTVAFHRALSLARELKRVLPRTVTVVGGPHVSSQPKQPLTFEAFDYAVRNEGEQTLVELLAALDSKRSVEDIAGLVWRNDAGIQVNPQRAYIADLDRLPFPAYDLIPGLKCYTPPPCNYKKSPVANIITSRGCPNRCTFCDSTTFGRKVRFRSAHNVADEIEHLMNHHGVKEIAFVDDTFTLQKKRIYDIFTQTRSRNLSFPWTCMARVNTVDEALLRFMKAAGCWHISFGIESGQPEILDLIRKQIDLQAVEAVIDTCHQLGILTKGFFIIGHPTETVESIDKTIALATRLKLDDVVVTINTPIPGSEQFLQAEQYGRLDLSSWSKYNYWNPVFIPHGLSRQILLAKHKEFYRRFYLRPRVLYRYAKSFMSLTGIRRLVRIASAARYLIPTGGNSSQTAAGKETP